MAEPEEKEDQDEPELKNGICTRILCYPNPSEKPCVYAMWMGEVKGTGILFVVPAALG